ncbi:MAG: hypothetical protein HY320_06085, partial [Armatimonadetes bacterium]|nr:hypothetical protein [Armatimonadota bacterium]
MIIALGTLYGVLGAILAVPATVIIKALYQQFYLEPRRAEAEPVAEETRRLIAA